MQLIFIHGWGTNSTIWQNTINHLNDHECVTIDLGFIKGGYNQTWDSTQPTILIGHSLGALWSLKQGQIKPEAFISIGGFTNFLSFTPIETIKKMQEGISSKPAAQMASFWRNAGCKNFAPASDLNKIALHEGLNCLAEWRGEEELKKLKCPKLILATKADKIVPKEATQSQWPDEAITWHETAPHCIQLTEAEWVASQIKQLIQDL